MARAKEFKIYVDINTGIVYEKPVKLAGVTFSIKKKFYEINRDQADRIEAGEPLGEVIREGVEAKIVAEVEAAVKKDTKLDVEPVAVKKAPFKKAPAKKVEVKKEAPAVKE